MKRVEHTTTVITGTAGAVLVRDQRRRLEERKKELRKMGADSFEGVTVVNGKVRQLEDE